MNPDQGKLSGTCPAFKARSLQALDQAGGDQQPVETARLGAAGAAIEQAMAALQDRLLLGEGRIERHAGGLLDHQRKIWRVERLKRGGQIGRLEIHRIDRIVTRKVARVERQSPEE